MSVQMSQVEITTPQAPRVSHFIESKSSEGAVKYVAISSGQWSSYLVRSDGAIDKTSGGRGVVKTYDSVDPDDPYVGASAGPHASYLLHKSGAVDRVTGINGIVSHTWAATEFTKYTAVSAGASQSYLVRDDGSVDRIRSINEVYPFRPEPDDVTYTMAGAGSEASYFLRSDGKVDRTRGFGNVDTTFECKASPYVAVSSQIAAQKNQEGGGGAYVSYLVRKDGKVDRVRTFGEVVQTLWPPEGTKYIASSCADMVSYMLRSDGAIDRIMGKLKGGATVDCTINPPPGVKYTAVSAGQWASYLLRDDGCVDRTVSGGKVTMTLAPSPGGLPPPASGGCCEVM